MKNTKYELNDMAMENIVGGQNADDENGSGFKCPGCGVRIKITIYDIIKGDAIVCKECGLIIPIEKTNSHNAIDALRKVKEAQENVNNKVCGLVCR